MAEERKDARDERANTFREFFGFELRPLTAEEVTTFVQSNQSLLEPVEERCRIDPEAHEVVMLIKHDEKWTFVLGTDERFDDDDLRPRSYCTKAWGYFRDGQPDFHTTRTRTAVYRTTNNGSPVADENGSGGFLLITDPPKLPLHVMIKSTNLESLTSGALHDLSLPGALQVAREIGGCRLPDNSVYFLYLNTNESGIRSEEFRGSYTVVMPDVHVWPPIWQTITTDERYYLIATLLEDVEPRYLFTKEDGTPIWALDENMDLETLTREDVNNIVRGRTVVALSSSSAGPRVTVLDPQIPHKVCSTRYETVLNCNQWYHDVGRSYDDFFEPLEAQDSAALRAVVAKPLDDEQQAPRADLKTACSNQLDHATQERWDGSRFIVTLFDKPGVAGHCFRLEHLLKDLVETRNTAYKWVGNFRFGRPDHTAKYHKLMWLNVWLDTNALDQLELSGSRLFALKPLGTQTLGHRSGSIKSVETDVYTLVPITNATAREYQAGL